MESKRDQMKHGKIAKRSYNHLQKTLEKLRKFWKSCNHKQNINGIYNAKLHNNCLQQLPTLRLRTSDLRKLGNSDEKKMKSSNYSLVPSTPAKN